MSKSAEIRRLGQEGLATAEIARRVGVRYQHAYNVLKAAGLNLPSAGSGNNPAVSRAAAKAPLLVEQLIRAGFVHSACWNLRDGRVTLDRRISAEPGVYAFVQDGQALYVGLATMGLAKRIYFYGRPGVSQKTSLRLNQLIADELGASRQVDVYSVVVPDLEWRELPINGNAGLELGLIKTFRLPWNHRSAG